MKIVEIEHKDGRRFRVTESDFKRQKIDAAGNTYADLGFRIVANADGSPYQPPESRPKAAPSRTEPPVEPSTGPARWTPAEAES